MSDSDADLRTWEEIGGFTSEDLRCAMVGGPDQQIRFFEVVVTRLTRSDRPEDAALFLSLLAGLYAGAGDVDKVMSKLDLLDGLPTRSTPLGGYLFWMYLGERLFQNLDELGPAERAVERALRWWSEMDAQDRGSGYRLHCLRFAICARRDARSEETAQALKYVLATAPLQTCFFDTVLEGFGSLNAAKVRIEDRRADSLLKACWGEVATTAEFYGRNEERTLKRLRSMAETLEGGRTTDRPSPRRKRA